MIIGGLILGKEGTQYGPIDLVLIAGGIIGLIIYMWLHPILLKGNVEIDKNDKSLLRRKKNFSKFGKDQIYNFSKMKSLVLVNVEGKNSKRIFKNYYLIDEEDTKHLFIRLLWNKKEKKESKILSLQRFENRLQEYTGLTLSESFEESDEVMNIIEEEEDEESEVDSSESLNTTKADSTDNQPPSSPVGGL